MDLARTLLGELIERMQADPSAGQTTGTLRRILVHVENIQKAVEQSVEDPANAIRRLRDFANAIERLGKNETSVDRRDLHDRLIAALRNSADGVDRPGAQTGWAGDNDSAACAS